MQVPSWKYPASLTARDISNDCAPAMRDSRRASDALRQMLAREADQTGRPYQDVTVAALRKLLRGAR